MGLFSRLIMRGGRQHVQNVLALRGTAGSPVDIGRDQPGADYGVEVMLSSGTYYRVDRAVAVVPVEGVLFSSEYVGSYQAAVRSAQAAARDPLVKHIVLSINSPGGAVVGVQDAAAVLESVREAMAAKGGSLIAYTPGCCCSAAYWLACACERVFAAACADVGSIGAMVQFEDWSKMLDEIGIKSVTVASGEAKGQPRFGEPITDETIASWKRDIEVIGAQFMDYVVSRRGEGARQFKDGRHVIATDALPAGLIDGVTTLHALVNDLNIRAAAAGFVPTPAPAPTTEPVTAPPPEPESTMSTTKSDAAALAASAGAGAAATPTPTPPAPSAPATLAELKTAFAGESDFIVAQLEAGATMQAAGAAFNTVLKTRLSESTAKVADLEKKAAAKTAGAPVVAHIEGGGAGARVTSGSATAEEFAANAQAYAAEKNVNVNVAMAKLGKKAEHRPGYAAWLNARGVAA